MQIYADSRGDAPPGYHRNQRLSDSLVTPKDELFAEEGTSKTVRKFAVLILDRSPVSLSDGQLCGRGAPITHRGIITTHQRWARDKKIL